jgi:hypothetical protein
MTIHSKYNNTLALYKDSNPTLEPSQNVVKSNLFASFNKHVPATYHVLQQHIESNTNPNNCVLKNIALIQRIVSFEKQYYHFAPALLDPPLTANTKDSNFQREAPDFITLNRQADLVKIKNRTRFFFVSLLPAASFPSQPAIKQANTLLYVYEILRHSLSKSSTALPLMIRHLALETLTCPHNPFNHLTRIKSLGSGAFGQVTLVQTYTGEYYAAKTALKHSPVMSFENEYYYLRSISHDHIIKVVHIDRLQKVLYLEFMKNGIFKTDLPSELTLQALIQTASALSYLHNLARPIIHADLKLDNVLMDEKFHVKIADFGLAFFKDTFKKCFPQKTPYYLPPELVRGSLSQNHCTTIDVWSLAIIFWECLKEDTLISPIRRVNPSKNPSQYWDPSFQGFQEGELHHQLNPKKVTSLDPQGHLIHLMNSCLHISPEKRPNIDHIIDQLKTLTLG